MDTPAAGELSKKTFKTFLLRLLTQLFTVGAGIIIARSLGPSGKGLFTYATIVLGLLVTLGTGASSAVSRQYGRLKLPSGVVYAAMMRFFFVVCLPIAALVAAVALLTHDFILLAPAIAFPLAYLNQVSVGFSLADGDVDFANFQGLVVAFLLLVSPAVLCYGFHLAVGAVLAGWVVVNGAVAIYSLAKIAKYARGTGTREERAAAFRGQFSFSFQVTLNQLLALANYQVDIFIVLFVLGHAALGRYSIAVGVGIMLWQLSRPLTATSYGTVTRGTPQEAARLTVLCVRHAFFSVGVASLVLAIVGPWLLQLVYGPAFAQSGRVLQLLLPGIIAYCAVPFFGQYFVLQLGKPGINTTVMATSTIVCAAVTLLLIRQFGIAAGAIGTSTSYCAALAICIYMFCRRTGVHPGELVAFKAADLQQYRSLARWIFSGVHAKYATYVRRGG